MFCTDLLVFFNVTECCGAGLCFAMNLHNTRVLNRSNRTFTALTDVRSVAVMVLLCCVMCQVYSQPGPRTPVGSRGSRVLVGEEQVRCCVPDLCPSPACQKISQKGVHAFFHGLQECRKLQPVLFPKLRMRNQSREIIGVLVQSSFANQAGKQDLMPCLSSNYHLEEPYIRNMFSIERWWCLYLRHEQGGVVLIPCVITTI